MDTFACVNIRAKKAIPLFEGDCLLHLAGRKARRAIYYMISGEQLLPLVR